VVIVAEVEVAAPAERVWRALRERDEVRRWHGWEAGSLDAEIEEIYFAHAEVDEARRTLTTSGTRIEVGDGSRVTFAMTAPLEDPVWDGWGQAVADGWGMFAEQLRFALERHPGEDRTTVYLEGPQERKVTAPVGERYETAGLSGEVWFRTDRLLGLTVDSWGDGLLVLGPDGAVLTAYGTTPELP
jgi:uncharacterized protein YndB with AHSA1/START domain